MSGSRQVIRFAVGSVDGPRSSVWRAWVPKNKSDLYVSTRQLGSAIKVSLHEPGPARIALTTEWIRRSGFSPPAGQDKRLAVEWQRPRSRAPDKVARPLTIIVPWDEVRERQQRASNDICWVDPPVEGMAVHFDVVYVPACMPIIGHPGQQDMGRSLIGRLTLENSESVFITAMSRPIGDAMRSQIDTRRIAPIIGKDGSRITKTGIFSFSTEPNPDATDGTEIGVLLDITRDLIVGA